jgi:IS30 family transposase
MRAYHRLTESERNQVYALKKAGLTQCAIADQICVNKSTILRELKHNAGLRGYACDKTDDERARLVRHGHLPERDVMTGTGQGRARATEAMTLRKSGYGSRLN